MRKKVFIMLSVILAISTHLFAYTDGEIVKFGTNTYKVVSASAKTLCFLGCDNSVSGLLDIPATIFDNKDVTFTVTEVGGSDIYRCSNITSVKLPDTMLKINWSSFNSAKLTKMNIPKNLHTIDKLAGWHQFSSPKCTVDPANSHFVNDDEGALYSKDMTELYWVPSQVTLNNGVYTVNEKVTKIYTNAFRNIVGLKKIILPKNLAFVQKGYPTIAPDSNSLEEFEIAGGGTTKYKVIDGVLFDEQEHQLVLYPRAKTTMDYHVPDGIKSVETYAITSANKMKTIDFNQVVKLELSALYKDYGLVTITLPKDLEENENIEGCIEFCLHVKEYKVPSDSRNYIAEDGIVFSKDKTKLYFYPPKKVKTAYTIPSTVLRICKRAFQGAGFLESITIPASVNTINFEAFRNMNKLTNVTFEEASSIQKLGGKVFKLCHALKEITLPSSLIEISDAFNHCNGLEKINMPNGSKLKEIKNDAFSLTPNLKEFNFLGSCDLTQIGTNAFANCTKLKTFDFPKSVTSIGRNAFNGCSSMSYVKFAPDATFLSFGEGSLADCGLTSIDIPEKVSKIERDAFRNCKVLTKVNLPATVTHVSPEAFKFCDKLTDIKVDKSNSKYSSIDGILLTKDKRTLVLFPPGKANDKFTLLPPSITAIGEYAFYECLALKNITIPNKVTSIGERAFGLCKNLKTVTFLCDAMIAPAAIKQGTNVMAFDDGSQAPSMFPNIDIYVRKSLEPQYKSDDFYKKFKSISASFIDGNGEYIPVSMTDVELLSTTTSDYTYLVPSVASNGVKSYTVSLVGDYLFEGKAADKVKEVVLRDNVEYIGARAFINDLATSSSTVEHVFFIGTSPTGDMLSTVRFELDETGENYNEFIPQCKIFVKKSVANKYRTVWNKYASQIDYKIPDVKIAKKYGTFAREFDTDFSEYNKEKGNSQVAAFVAGSNILPGGGDYGASTYHVKMRSIDEKQGLVGNYGYVPANTGVLLKVLDKDDTASDFYYTIGEKDNATYNVTDNIMHGVTVNNAKVEASATDPVYVMQGGVFRKAETTIGSFPVHRAYMKTDALPSGAKIELVFDEVGGSTTGIETVAGDNVLNVGDVYYNLNGQRVDRPQRGVYIRNGKKVIIK